MSLTVAIIVLIALALTLFALLGGVMSWPRNLSKHRAAGGKPAARVRRFRRTR